MEVGSLVQVMAVVKEVQVMVVSSKVQVIVSSVVRHEKNNLYLVVTFSKCVWAIGKTYLWSRRSDITCKCE